MDERLEETEKIQVDSRVNINERNEELEARGFRRIGSQTYHNIEYPGLVENLDKAIETLGGLPNLEKTITSRKNKPLYLTFRKDDNFSHPLTSLRRPCNSLLLKVKRRVKVHRSSGVRSMEFDYEVVGSINSTFRFRDLADYQYVSDTPANSKYNELLNVFKSGQYNQLENFDFNLFNQNSSHLLPLPIFSNQKAPHEYDFKQAPYLKLATTTDADGSTKSEWVSMLKNRNISAITYVSFTDKLIPMGPSADALSRKLQFASTALDEVEKLFHQRKVWSRVAIRNQLSHSYGEQSLTNLLVLFGFFFSDGPWGRCWVKHGYDPRTDREAVWLQAALLVRQKHPGSSIAQIYQDTKEEVDYAEHQFGQPNPPARNRTSHILMPGKPRLNAVYQLIDIHDDRVHQLIRKDLSFGSVSTPTFEDGWLAKGTLLKINRLLRKEPKRDMFRARGNPNAPKEFTDATQRQNPTLDHHLEGGTNSDLPSVVSLAHRLSSLSQQLPNRNSELEGEREAFAQPRRSDNLQPVPYLKEDRVERGSPSLDPFSKKSLAKELFENFQPNENRLDWEAEISDEEELEDFGDNIED